MDDGIRYTIWVRFGARWLPLGVGPWSSEQDARDFIQGHGGKTKGVFTDPMSEGLLWRVQRHMGLL